jgi:exopolysaccharide biosynthesis polyprenyl glycosylphosphotransferase
MGDLITNRIWDTGSNDCPSQYARMIPGTSAMPHPRVATARCTPRGETNVVRPVNVNANDETRGWILPRKPAQQLASHFTVDRFPLFQSMIADQIVLVVVCCASWRFSPGWGLPWAYLPVFTALVTLFGFWEGLYDAKDPFPPGIVPALAKATFFAIGLVSIAAWDRNHPFAAGAMFATNLAILVLCRRLRQMTWKQRCGETELRKVLIVGGGPLARTIAQTLRNDPLHHTTVCGFVDDDLPLSPVVLGRISDLDWLARAEFIDEVILALPDQPALARVAAEVAFRNHLDIRAVPDLPSGPWPDSTVDHIGEIPVITLHREPLPSAALFLKRSIDLVAAALGLVLVSPLMVIVALLIRLDSSGPVIYRAKRTGAKGRPFRCLKFRSMVTDAEHLKEELRTRNQRQGPIFKIVNDPRVTRIGHIIRRYSLDELPQLWNVLRGEMSLVGPRPHPVDEVNHYELQHYRRLDVKPGITGLWQITARGCPSFDLNMHLDLTYIENWSLLLDLRILAGTIRVLFAPEGA